MENDDKALAAVKFVVAVKVVVVSGGVIFPLLLFPICEGTLEEEEGAKVEIFEEEEELLMFSQRTDKGGGVGFGEKWARKFKSAN